MSPTRTFRSRTVQPHSLAWSHTAAQHTTTYKHSFYAYKEYNTIHSVMSALSLKCATCIRPADCCSPRNLITEE